MTMLDTALTYTGAGWPIFPLEPHGKQPLGKLAPHGLKDATLQEEIVRRWWKAEPQANIAIPTGIVFDVGDIDSDQALQHFQELCREHDTDPSTFPRAKTGRGGRHVFVAPTGVGNKVDVIPGMDWRGKGGYVVVPDSVHPSGVAYEWILKVIGEPPPCPDWLLALITKPVLIRPSLVSEEAPEAYVKAAVDAEMAKLRGTPIGQRNDQLNRSAFALGQMVGAGWLERGRAEAELRAAAHAIDHGREPGLTATIMSGLEAGRAEPRQAPVEGWGTAGGVIRQGVQSRTTGLVVAAPEVSARPAIYSAAELEQKEIVEPRAVVPGVIFVGLNMLAGKGKLGKSWLALAMALGIASGGEVLGHPVPAAEVLYLALEDTERRLKVRINKLWPNKKWPKTLHISHQWPKLDEGGVQIIEEWLSEHSACSLVIIDVWKRLRHKRAKNASLYDEDYEHLVPLQAIAQRYEVAILVVHHTRKAAAEDVFDEISGSGGVLAALDSCIILHRARSEADGEIWVTGRDLEEAHLALKFEDGHWSLLGSVHEVARSKERREIIEVITAQGGKMITVAELAVITGKPRNRINQLVFKMLTAGELRRSNSTYGLPVITNEGKGGNRGNHGNQDDYRLPVHVKSSKEAITAITGCPECGTLAYSPHGNQRRCHKCGTLYGVVA